MFADTSYYNISFAGNFGEKISEAIEEIYQAEIDLEKEREARLIEEREVARPKQEKKDLMLELEENREWLINELREIEMNGGPKDAYEMLKVREHREIIKELDEAMKGLVMSQNWGSVDVIITHE